MAKKTSKDTVNSTTETKEKFSWRLSRQQKFILGILLIFISIALLLSFISYFITGNNDQNVVNELANRNAKADNWLGKFGAYLADFFLYKGFGVASFIFVRILFLIGAYLILNMALSKLKKSFFWDIYLIIFISVIFGFFWEYLPQLGGTVGFEMNLFIQDYIGKTGTLLVLLFGIVLFLVFKIKMSPESFTKVFEKPQAEFNEDIAASKVVSPIAEEIQDEEINTDLPITTPSNTKDDFILTEDEEEMGNFELKTYPSTFEIDKEALKPTIASASELNLDPKPKVETPEVTNFSIEDRSIPKEDFVNEDAFVIEKIEEEVLVEENLAAKLVQDFGLFDPTLELSHYQFPPIDLLKEYSSGGITINQAELEENKNKIVDTLKNYSIGISQIKATVGPTVTL
ncbi:MAG: DNA translocase FtsK 4TM domain-containing protein, partial [Flavobacterium sp.]|nr:DNA translocase FtsK 4TM domain-containing protein [Flavobacterium sp.]